MKIENNESMAHLFFYKGVCKGVDCLPEKSTVTYRGWRQDCARFYSYGTIIGAVFSARKGARPDVTRPDTGVLVISYDPMSRATNRHIGSLRYASPFSAVIRIPMEKYDCRMTPELVKERAMQRLEHHFKNITKKEHRLCFHEICDSYMQLCKVPYFRGVCRKSDLSKYGKAIADTGKFVAERKRENAAAAAKKAAETRRIARKYAPRDAFGRNRLLQLLYTTRDASSRGELESAGISGAARRTLLQGVAEKGATHVAWYDPDSGRIATNRGITVDAEAALRLLRAWKAGKDLRRKAIDGYGIIKTDGPVIQIGCHRLGRRNLSDLHEVIEADRADRAEQKRQ